MSIAAQRTAVVLIEFQNEFASPGGAMHDAVAPVMEANDMLDKTVALVDQAREAGATIVHVPIAFAPGYGEVGDQPYGMLARIVGSGSFVKGTWGAEIVEDLAPEDGDILVEGKRGLDAFMSTNLDFILRSKGLSTVVLTGFLTNCCVESTMRTAYEKGYDVYTVVDCVAATSRAGHDNAIAHDFPLFSKPITAAELTASLAGFGDLGARRAC